MPPSCKPPEKVLKRLGLSEEDVRVSEKLISQIPPAPCSLPTVNTKAERILGYTETRLKRAKALRFLGATEDDVELENAKNLGALGLAGRRRSFTVGVNTETRVVGLPLYFRLDRASRRRNRPGLNPKRLSLPHRRRRGSSNRLSRRHTTGDVSRSDEYALELRWLRKCSNGPKNEAK